MTNETDLPKETLRRHLDRQGRLEQWILVEGFNWMKDSMKRQAANEEAENRWWRKTVTGESQPVDNADDEEMGNIMLGDVNHPAPVVISPPPQSNSIQTALLATALSALAGVGGYLLAGKDSEPSQVPNNQVEFDDSSVTIGLGKIEDYLKKDADQ